MQSARLEWCSHSKWNGAVSQTGKCGQATGTVQSDMWNLHTGRRYTRITIARLYEAEINTQRAISTYDFATLNDYYDFLGVEHFEGGDEIGFSINGNVAPLDILYGIEDEYITIEFLKGPGDYRYWEQWM